MKFSVTSKLQVISLPFHDVKVEVPFSFRAAFGFVRTGILAQRARQKNCTRLEMFKKFLQLSGKQNKMSYI